MEPASIVPERPAEFAALDVVWDGQRWVCTVCGEPAAGHLVCYFCGDCAHAALLDPERIARFLCQMCAVAYETIGWTRLDAL